MASMAGMFAKKMALKAQNQGKQMARQAAMKAQNQAKQYALQKMRQASVRAQNQAKKVIISKLGNTNAARSLVGTVNAGTRAAHNTAAARVGKMQLSF